MITDYFSSMPAPRIRRTRGYFLYTADGRRFLDFYQDNGRALLGHRVPGMQRALKSTVAKGLLAPYPSVYSQRVERMVKKLFPSCNDVRMYRTKERLCGAVAAALHKPVHTVRIRDPLFHDSGELMLWRPFLPGPQMNAPFLVPVLPFPGDFAPWVVVVNQRNLMLPVSDTVSPFLTDALVKVTAQLYEKLSLPEEDLSAFDSPFWERRGRYLVMKVEEPFYKRLYEKALRAEIFLPPSVSLAGIIPLEHEPGQIKKFLKLLKEAE